MAVHTAGGCRAEWRAREALDLDSGAELRRCDGHEGWVWAVAVLADNRRALSAGEDRTLRLWDLDSP